ncbi:MAG TPA: primosomal replication protein N [Nitrosomonas sp.]|nr:primosomal replication protein N [Nitrosomonas sp.]HMW20293.1 primosomal replication protein N [Nitrosomonas sp.]HMW68499.1 primosomal replication protein N [Nitrosomonas sp.]HMY60502.1 primosomal replication protein N [Nitrosomonas sp.]HMY91079.1 primosomal replication protein N [Nitrosomonas sp.]
MNCNLTTICGKLIKLNQIRYTPAGIEVIEFEINHNSTQTEASIHRQITCVITAIAMAHLAKTVSSLTIETSVKLTGFLAKKSKISSQLVLHVSQIDVI